MNLVFCSGTIALEKCRVILHMVSKEKSHMENYNILNDEKKVYLNY